MKLAMSVGRTNHYRIDGIHGRHFMETAAAAGLPKTMARAAIEEVLSDVESALERVEGELPPRFPANIHAPVSKAVAARLGALAAAK
jgi:serine/threonine-protein kinase HipA